MWPVNLLLAILIVPRFLKELRNDKLARLNGNHPSNELYDHDLDKIGKHFNDCVEQIAKYDEDLLYKGDICIACPRGGCNVPIQQWEPDLTCPECDEEEKEQQPMEEGHEDEAEGWRTFLVGASCPTTWSGVSLVKGDSDVCPRLD